MLVAESGRLCHSLVKPSKKHLQTGVRLTTREGVCAGKPRILDILEAESSNPPLGEQTHGNGHLHCCSGFCPWCQRFLRLGTLACLGWREDGCEIGCHFPHNAFPWGDLTNFEEETIQLVNNPMMMFSVAQFHLFRVRIERVVQRLKAGVNYRLTWIGLYWVIRS